MSHARAALIGLNATLRSLNKTVHFPSVLASSEVLRTSPDLPLAAPPEDELRRLRALMKKLAAEGHGYGTVEYRKMRKVPWLLWDGSEPLATLPGLLDALLEHAVHKRGLLRAMIEAWITDYQPGAPGLDKVARALRRLVSGHSHPAMMKWRETDQRIGLFGTPDGHKAVARWLLEGEPSTNEKLEAIGFADPVRARSGLLHAVQSTVLDKAPALLGKPTGERLLSNVIDLLLVEGSLRFDDAESRGVMARSLLAPWYPGAGRAPAESVRVRLQGFLLQHMGDPRRGSAGWLKAGKEASAIMRQWLAKASLQAFFKIIGDHALDGHWKYRAAFWNAYIERGQISDARLVLGSNVANGAQTIAELRGSFASLSGQGVDSNHSVLLMRIGRLVICEWSHNGKVRAWPADWSNAPQLDRQNYSRADLTRKGTDFPPTNQGKGGNSDGSGLSHFQSENGYWQQSVARLIAKNGGLHLTPREYMPR